MGEKFKNIQIRYVVIAFCFALAVLCGSILLDGGGSSGNDIASDEAAQQVEIEVSYAYQNQQWNSAIEKIIAGFEETHSDIKIKYEVNYEHKVYEDILAKKIARDELGDIVQLKTVEPYAASGTIAPIAEDVAALSSSNYIYNGEVYGLGEVQSTSGILYNKKIFERYNISEPTTWEEFLKICVLLKNYGITPIGVGGSDLWHMEYWVNHFFRTDVLSVNEDWLADCAEGRVSWTDPEPTKMMTNLYTLFEKGYVNENWLTTSDSSLSYKMTEGEVAMIFTGPWTAAAIEKIDPDMELGWFYVPSEDGTVYAGDNSDTFWAITAGCAGDEEKYAAAVTFLAYFYSQDVYTELCESTRTFPLASQDISLEMDDVQKDVFDAFESADRRMDVYIGNEDTPQEFEKLMLNITQQILSGELSVEDGMMSIRRAWLQSD